MSKNVLTPSAEPYYDDEIDLRELFAVLRAGKNKILAVTAVFALSLIHISEPTRPY